MLENVARIGAPSFFPYVNAIAGGGGGPCSQGVINGFLKGQHKFLPFVANGINWVASQGQDVISAHFSGCIMASYRDNGVAKVCHISTGAGFGDCKAAWDALKAQYTHVFEFRPSDFIEDTPHTKCYGLITSDVQTYSVLVNTKRIALPRGGQATSDEQFVKVVNARLLR